MKSYFSNIPIVILAGGKGERFVNKKNLPKQLIKISKNTILMEIINYYKKSGFNFFILPLGEKKFFFLKYFYDKKNIHKYNLNIIQKLSQLKKEKINILLFDSGKNSSKILRIKKSIKYLDGSYEIAGVAYGDVYANINLNKQLKIMKKNNVDAILASYNEKSPFGHLQIDNNFTVNNNKDLANIKKIYKKNKNIFNFRIINNLK